MLGYGPGVFRAAELNQIGPGVGVEALGLEQGDKILIAKFAQLAVVLLMPKILLAAL